MLIILAFPIGLYNLFLNFVFMKSRWFNEKPKTIQTSAGRWIRIMPDEGNGYLLFDLTSGRQAGRIMVDEQNYWVYDGSILGLDEQDEVAGQIVGYQIQMDQLLKTLNFGL